MSDPQDVNFVVSGIAAALDLSIYREMIHDVHGYEKSSFSRDYNRFLAEAGLVRSKSLVGVEIRLFDLAVFQRDLTVKRRTLLQEQR